MTDVAVIGAGSAGLAVMRALSRQGVSVVGFERGSKVGGLWQYQNDNGLSAAYASLRTNVSRQRMQYPSLPMPMSAGEYPHHSEMAAYLEAFADKFHLRQLIQFRTTVRRVSPRSDGTWSVVLEDGSVRSFGAIVIATGLFWAPRVPERAGGAPAGAIHSHAYREPEPYAGQRVLVVGGGQSAAEIAVEVSGVAARTILSLRRGAHVIPRWLGGRPYDDSDTEPLNRLPWRLLNAVYARRVARELGPTPPSWPSPRSRLLEGIPIISSDLFPAVRRGAIEVKPAVERFASGAVRFVDGSDAAIDRVVFAVGYQLKLPFLDPLWRRAASRDFPLYRRIVDPDRPGLYFCGFVDAPGGLLPVVETQGEWIAATITGRLRLPQSGHMFLAIDRSERRTRERFPDERPTSTKCDPHAYRRLLRKDLRRVSGTQPPRARQSSQRPS